MMGEVAATTRTVSSSTTTWARSSDVDTISITCTRRRDSSRPSTPGTWTGRTKTSPVGRKMSRHLLSPEDYGPEPLIPLTSRLISMKRTSRSRPAGRPLAQRELHGRDLGIGGLSGSAACTRESVKGPVQRVLQPRGGEGQAGRAGRRLTTSNAAIDRSIAYAHLQGPRQQSAYSSPDTIRTTSPCHSLPR